MCTVWRMHTTRFLLLYKKKKKSLSAGEHLSRENICHDDAAAAAAAHPTDMHLYIYVHICIYTRVRRWLIN